MGTVERAHGRWRRSRRQKRSKAGWAGGQLIAQNYRGTTPWPTSSKGASRNDGDCDGAGPGARSAKIQGRRTITIGAIKTPALGKVSRHGRSFPG
jgi:hypothetical protein